MARVPTFASSGFALVLAAIAPAQQYFLDLGGRTLPARAGATVKVVLAHVDGDGDPDLFFANYGQSLLHLGDSTGLRRRDVDGLACQRLAVQGRHRRGIDVALRHVPHSCATLAPPVYQSNAVEPTSLAALTYHGLLAKAASYRPPRRGRQRAS